jgi:hypothetical protein
MSDAPIDPSRLDSLLSGCGVTPMNILTLDGGWRFVCFVGPATARAGGVAEAGDAVRGAGLRCDFHWANRQARADGYGRCFVDVTR